MIEINLLPEEMRQAEGTPPARFAVIIAGVVLASGIGVITGKYYLVDIPSMKTEIKNRDLEIAALRQREQNVKDTIAKIETLKQKVATLDNLIQSRLRYARLLDYLCNTVPEGVWFRSFNMQPDNTPPGPGSLPGAKRYMISLTGYTTGGSGATAALEQRNRLKDLMDKLEYWFREVSVDSKTGINGFVGGKFNRPKLVSTVVTSVPQPNERDPKILKALDPPKDGLDFSMTLSFELPMKLPGT